MVDQLAAWGLVIGGLALGLTTLANVIGAALYDVRAAKLERQRRAHPHARRYRRRPLITVLITTQNNAASIRGCLDSLRRSSYRKLQIIVVDNVSTDDTRKEVRSFMAQYPSLHIRLVAKRTPALPAEATKQAQKTYAQGELVLLLQATERLDRQALRKAANYLNDYPGLSELTPRRRATDASSLGGLLQMYLSLLGQRAAKASSLWRHQAYAHDVIIEQPAAASYLRLCLERRPALKSARRSLARLLGVSDSVVAVLAPLLMSYFIYLALSLREPTFLMLSLAGLGIWLLAAVWADEQLGFRRRLAYTAGIPLTYSLFYGLAWARLLATGRTIIFDRVQK